jgi:hypothetical protein
MPRGRKIQKALKLPIIKKALPEPPPLNMDDYLKFVTMNLKYCPPPKLSRKQEMALRVTVPFVIK